MLVLRLLGPVIVVLTMVLLFSGVLLVVGPLSIRSQMSQIHHTSFFLWFLVTAIHVLGHIVETAKVAPRDLLRATRSQVQGASARLWSSLASLLLGLLAALWILPYIAKWSFAGWGH